MKKKRDVTEIWINCLRQAAFRLVGKDIKYDTDESPATSYVAEQGAY